jgi:ectoine hydroxylase-related dioxygenase (phytanoyl-CoA dioxygenase family)
VPVSRELHPWNAGFEWRGPDRTGTTVSPEQAEQFDELGYFVFPDAFDADTLSRLDAALAPGDERAKEFLASAPDGRFGVTGVDTQVVAPHAVTRDDFVRAFTACPTLAGIARDLVGPDVRLYWDQSVYKQPHSTEPVLWHQDNGYTYVEPQSYLTCWIAITDATPENGCVSVMPRVHGNGTLRHRSTPIGEECWGDWETAVDVPVRAGSIVVFTSLTPHATRRNVTDKVRKAYIVQYVPDGAVAHFGDPSRGAPARTEVCADDVRRFFVVRDGERVDPPARRAAK